MDMSSSTDRGTFGSGVTALQLTTAPTRSGGSCFLSESPTDGPATACFETGDLFADHAVVYLVQSDGGPAAGQINYLRVVGVVSPGVDRLQVVFTSGARYDVPINSEGGFDFEAPLATARSGDLPAQLVAYSNGSQIGGYSLSQR